MKQRCCLCCLHPICCCIRYKSLCRFGPVLNTSNTMLPLFLKVLIPNFTGKHIANARLIPSWCPQSSRVEIDCLDRLCLWYTSIIAVLVFSFLCFAMSCLGELWPFKDGTEFDVKGRRSQNSRYATTNSFLLARIVSYCEICIDLMCLTAIF